MGKRYTPGQVATSGPLLTSNVPSSPSQKAQVSSDLFGAQRAKDLSNFGSSLSNVGSTVTEMGANLLSKIDKTDATNAHTAAILELNEDLSPLKNKTGPESRMVGKQASELTIAIRDKYLKQLDESGASSATKEAFNVGFSADITNHVEQMYDLQTRNIDKEDKLALANSNQAFIDNAVNVYRQDMVAFRETGSVIFKNGKDAIATASAAIDANTRQLMKGADKAQVDAVVKDTLTNLHTSIVQDLSNSSPTDALSYLNANAKYIDTKVVDKLKTQLSKAATEEMSVVTANKLNESGLPVEKQLALVDAQYEKDGDEELYKATKSEVINGWKVKEALKDKIVEDMFNSEVYKTLSDPTYRPRYNPLFSASENATIKNLFENKTSGSKKADDMALYAQIVSGELEPTASEFAKKYAKNFKESTSRKLIDFIADRDKKDGNAMQVMTSYQQAKLSIGKSSDFNTEKEAGRKLLGQFYAEYKQRLEILPLEKRKDQKARQEIIDDMLKPVYGSRYFDNIYKFQLPYEGKENQTEFLSNPKNIPARLEDEGAVLDPESNYYFKDDDRGIRHVYDPLTGLEVWKGRLIKGR